MGFTFSHGLTKLLASLGVLQADVLAKFHDIVAEYPDLATAEKIFSDWLTGTIGDQFTEASATQIVASVWAELASGHPGYNPHHGGLA